MAARPVEPAASWKLAAAPAARAQGLVATGFGALETGRALFLEFRWPETQPDDAHPGRWLQALRAVAPITSAEAPSKTDPDAQRRAAALAFTWTGLQRMGLPKTALASFSRPFREGMLQEDRLRRLGDRREGVWQGTVVDGGPFWSGNGRPDDALAARVTSAYDVEGPETAELPWRTRLTVHALLLLYAKDEGDATDWTDEVEGALTPMGVAIVHQLGLTLNTDPDGRSREHFGFADGLSQPLPWDETGAVGSRTKAGDAVQDVPLGEFLMGYYNGHHERAPGPLAPAPPTSDPAVLPPHPEAQGFLDLGLDGSYLVVRELKQDVAEFWASMDKAAAALRRQDPAGSAHVDADWLAARVVGRDRSGALLCPGEPLPLASDGMPDSGYRFHERDPHGLGCPAGSHVRRAFPRDALAPNPKERETLLQAANNHRILRRGRKFGPRVVDERTADGADRGLLFMCLNTDIARQFEFVQQTWLLNRNFATLYDEVDPLVGDSGRMTIREEPLRRVATVSTFIRMAGGDYFFLPSLPALAYLATL